MKPLYNRVIFAAGTQVWVRATNLIPGPVADRSWHRLVAHVDTRVWDRVGFHIRPHIQRCIEGGVR